MNFNPQAYWVEDPESKGKVESAVKYVRRDSFYERSFEDLINLNKKAFVWETEMNHQIHSTTRLPSYELWVEEKSFLSPLISREPRIFRTITVKVNKAHLFPFGGNQYSVPKEYARKTIYLEIDEKEFRAFFDELAILTYKLQKRKKPRIWALSRRKRK